ncbi:MAG TPA: HPr(Ser) kinase/phosphatase [Mariprofundaceae bacterium]|nr:HPr(Ser) kinase/phosphatase [Mariprofundaceae bacterium]
MNQDYTRITVREIFDEQGSNMRMRLLAGEAGLGRFIDHPRIQKPSLAFAGFLNLSDYRMQVIGRTELDYLATRSEAEQKQAVDAVFDLRLACVVITRDQTPPNVILEAAERTDTPIFSSTLSSAEFMTDMTIYLTHRLAPRVYQHGVYVDVFGLGVLLTGASGIGKSEIALELIGRGHRLIADDMVELARESPDVLVGRSPETLRYHIEIRGLGILNIRDLFGAAALTDAKRVGLVVEVIPWQEMDDYDRLLVEERSTRINDVQLPKVVLPVRPGRSLAVLVEVATRNQLLKMRGIDSGKAFVEALHQRIEKGQK